MIVGSVKDYGGCGKTSGNRESRLQGKWGCICTILTHVSAAYHHVG